MRNRALSLWLLVVATGATIAWASPAAAAPMFMGLGDLPGGSFRSQAYAVSADGSVVVGESNSASGDEAFRWTSGGGMLGLGDLPGGIFWSQAYNVSADGSVVVGADHSTVPGRSSEFQAYRWTSGGGMVGLGHLQGPGRQRSSATGVSADGTVVVGESNSFPDNEAFRWTSGGGMVGLGVLPGGAFTSYAEGVSADGTVVVGESGSYSVFGDEAFRWTLGGGMVGLGDLPGGFFYSYAYDVSADGSVVVGWSDSASGNEAFRWTSGGGMVGLGDLPGGSFSSRAECVSADGAVVVGVSDSASGDEAFRWTAAGGMRSVRDILVNDYGLNLTGWTLGQTTGISSDGTTLVGFGTNPSGFTEAWIAVIPRDITVAATSRQGLTVYAGVLMMTGLLGIAYRQRRHGRAA